MKHPEKTKQQLLKEIIYLKDRIAESEKNKELFQIITEKTNDNIAIVTFDLKAQYLYVSPSAKHTMGYDPDDLLGKSFFDFIHPDDKKALLPLLKKYIDSVVAKILRINDPKITETIEFRFKNKDGDWRYMHSTINFIGKNLLAVTRDISERKKAEEKLISSEKTFRAITENSPVGIYYNDMSGTFLFGNKKAEEIVGYKQHELVGKNFLKLKLLNSNDILKAGRILALNNLGKSTGPDHFTLNTRSGAKKQVEITTTIIDVEGQKVVMGMVQDISERKKTEETLRSSEENFRTIFEGAYDAIVHVDKKTRILNVNQAFTEITGFSKEEVVGKLGINLAKKFVNIKQLPDILAMIKKVASKRPIKPYDLIFRDKILEVSTNFQDDGQIVGIVRDITDRKKVEEALRDSEERLKIIYDNAPDSIFIGSVDGTIIDGNRAAEEMIGYSKEELVGKNILNVKLVVPSDYPKITKAMAKSALGLKTGPVVYKAIKKNGSYFYAEISTFPVNINNTKLVLCIARDISQRAKAEEELRESEEKYRSLFEQSADSTLIIEEDLFVDCNQATLDMLGYSSKDEFLSTHPSQVSPEVQPDGRKSFEKANEMMAIAYKKGSHRFEWMHKRKNNEIFPVEVLLTAVPIGKDKFLHVVWRDITDRKKAEAALLRSENQYRSFFEKDISGIYLSTPQGKLLDCNPAFAKMLGYNSKEILKIDTRILYPKPTNREVFLNRLIEHKILIDEEIDLVRKNGELIHCIENVVGDFDENGTLVRFQGYLMNITERKRTEKILKENEQKLRNIFDNSTNLFYSHTTDHKLTYLSPQVKEILGYSQEEALMRWTDFVSDNPINEAGFKATQKAIETGERQPPYEMELIKKSGEKIWVEVREAPIIKNGKTESVVGALSDITKRKTASEALIESEIKYRTLIEDSNDGIYLLFNRRFEIVNDKFLQITGYTREEINEPGFDFMRLVSPKSRNFVEERNNRINNGEKPPSKYDFTAIRKNGEEYELEVSVSFIEYKEGFATQGTIRDITERKKQQEILMNTIIQVQEDEKFKIGKELHDGLGQLLISASMYLESLNKIKNQLPENKREDLRKARKLYKQAISDARRISHGLMVTGIHEHGILYLIKQLCLNSNVPELTFTFTHQNINEEMINEEIKVHIYRIVQELITNILKHSSASKANIKLNYYVKGILKLVVSDNGKGFDPEKVKYGAGLNNVKQRIAILNGKHSVSASKEQGTTVRATIPL